MKKYLLLISLIFASILSVQAQTSPTTTTPTVECSGKTYFSDNQCDICYEGGEITPDTHGVKLKEVILGWENELDGINQNFYESSQSIAEIKTNIGTAPNPWDETGLEWGTDVKWTDNDGLNVYSLDAGKTIQIKTISGEVSIPLTSPKQPTDPHFVVKIPISYYELKMGTFKESEKKTKNYCVSYTPKKVAGTNTTTSNTTTGNTSNTNTSSSTTSSNTSSTNTSSSTTNNTTNTNTSATSGTDNSVVADITQKETQQKLVGTWQDNDDSERVLIFNSNGTYQDGEIRGTWTIFTKNTIPKIFFTLWPSNIADNTTYLINVPNAEQGVGVESYYSIKNITDTSLEFIVEPSDVHGGIVKFTKKENNNSTTEASDNEIPSYDAKVTLNSAGQDPLASKASHIATGPAENLLFIAAILLSLLMFPKMNQIFNRG